MSFTSCGMIFICFKCVIVMQIHNHLFSLLFLDDEFHGHQPAKQKVLHKCRYLDERNIILSPDLFVQSRFDICGTNDASDGANTRWKASQLNSKPSANLESILTRAVAPNHSVPINPSVSADSMTQNIVLSENSTSVCLIGVSEALPMIEWIPTSSHVQASEETVSANRETRSPQPAWKRASVHRLEWCHECPAKVAHLGLSSSTADGPYAARSRVIRRVARVSGGYRAGPVQSSHVEEKLCPPCPYRLPDRHKVMHKSCYKTGNQIYECLCSSLQPRARDSPGGDQRDATQILEKTEHGQKREFSEVIREMVRMHISLLSKSDFITLLSF